MDILNAFEARINATLNPILAESQALDERIEKLIGELKDTQKTNILNMSEAELAAMPDRCGLAFKDSWIEELEENPAQMAEAIAFGYSPKRKAPKRTQRAKAQVELQAIRQKRG